MSRFTALVLAALAGPTLWAADAKLNSFRFTKEYLGMLPPGWTAAKTGTGEGSIWKVVADTTAPSRTDHALAQMAKGPKPLFNLCIADAQFTNLEVSVALKAVAGEIDQGGGIVWRLQDPKNYYIARLNPLEGNFRLYKVADGKRIQLATAEDVKAGAGTWHLLKVRQVGPRTECYLDGKKLLEATDSTFPQAGKVGLWTKADAQTYFSDFKVQELRK